MPQQSILILGGGRSGKSSFAERLASTSSSKVAYIATAKPIDLEMSTRIDRHKSDRQANVNSAPAPSSSPDDGESKLSVGRRRVDWVTVEEPVELVSALDRLPEGATTLVVDCLTVCKQFFLVDLNLPNEHR